MPPKQKYTHLSHRNQILKRPGQHIGSASSSVKNIWLAETFFEDSNDATAEGAGAEVSRIIEKEVTINPGLMHIFYEVLSNAQDNYFRSLDTDTPLKVIKVTVEPESGLVTVWNDGLWIPVRIHEWSEEEEVIDSDDHYEAEIIFGYLNSSSNYDDSAGRTGGGIHGVGVKLTNIFSKWFEVVAFDPEEGKKFQQEYSENMEQHTKPKVTKLKQKKGFTKVSYLADFARFHVKGYNDNYVAAMKKMCIDCAMITGAKVYFNDQLLPVKNLMSYAEYYTDKKRIEFKSADSTVVLCEKEDYHSGFAQISFVNGIYTARGGIHVDRWKTAIFKPLLDKIKKKFEHGKQSNNIRLTPKSLENYFMLFVNSSVVNPEWEGQTKAVLSKPAVETNVPESKLNKIMKWDFINEVSEMVKVQGMKELQKTDGKKNERVSIEKADDANKAGTAESQKCTLFITEGLSAKAFAVKGISTLDRGRDYFGILPIRGKMLNVQKAAVTQLNNNAEIIALKKMLGLQHGVDYSDAKNFSKLRYGKVRILTDADLDGDHIKGLLINFFQYFFPSLINRKYLASLRTPIIKIKNKVFYFMKDYKEWAVKQKTKNEPKYYKGLGTNTDSEILQIFKDPRYVQYLTDNNASESVSKIFSKNRSNDRKDWLENYRERDFTYPKVGEEEHVKITDFFNNEMVVFSIYDNQRSIPSLVDGLKPSQRKALWVSFKELNQKTDYKVAQFSSEVAKQAAYHHGEVSLEQTIVGMTQTFVGSNNISYFSEQGQFGTRVEGGKDAAAGRYIFIRQTSLIRFIFRKEDDPLLDYLVDEGKSIEPRNFVPIIPMLLVNGADGMGTGYSTSIPAYNPTDLVEWIYWWLDNFEQTEKKDYPEFVPWYWGFKGETIVDGPRVRHLGKIEELGEDHYRVTELPVGVWTSTFKENLEHLISGQKKEKKGVKGKVTTSAYSGMTVAQLKEALGERGQPTTGVKTTLIARLQKCDKELGITKTQVVKGRKTIEKYHDHSGAYNVDIEIFMKKGVQLELTPEYKLSSGESLSNLTAFTPTGGLKKYPDVYNIIDTFCKVRYQLYLDRKKYLIKVLEEKLLVCQEKARFIEIIIDDFELLQRNTTAELNDFLAEKEFYAKDGNYRYLTMMPVTSFNVDKVEELEAEIENLEKEILYLRKKTAKQMWVAELKEFSREYEKWRKEIEKAHAELNIKPRKIVRKGRGKKK